jgi:hypothetical protein
MLASEVTATAIISRASSDLPMEKTLTRGDAFSSMRMSRLTSAVQGSLPGAPAMSPITAFGVGTFFEAGG